MSADRQAAPLQPPRHPNRVAPLRAAPPTALAAHRGYHRGAPGTCHRRAASCAIRSMLSPCEPATTCSTSPSAATFTHTGLSHSCSPARPPPAGRAASPTRSGAAARTVPSPRASDRRLAESTYSKHAVFLQPASYRPRPHPGPARGGQVRRATVDRSTGSGPGQRRDSAGSSRYCLRCVPRQVDILAAACGDARA